MEEIIKKLKKGNQILEIRYCNDPESPRDDSNLGIMICNHRRYNLSDRNESFDKDKYSNWEEVKTMLVEEREATHILPVYLFDHSGLSLSTTPFGCRWDSGQVGFIYATEHTQNELGITKDEDVMKILKSEIELYNKHLQGEVFEYILYEIEECECCKHKSKKVLDSCGYFYDIDDIVKEQQAEDWEDITNV